MLYIALLVIILAPSIFAAWPPEGVVSRQTICYPRLNGLPWDVPASSYSRPWVGYDQTKPIFQFDDIIYEFGYVLFGFRIYSPITYFNHSLQGYDRTIAIDRILQNR